MVARKPRAPKPPRETSSHKALNKTHRNKKNGLSRCTNNKHYHDELVSCSGNMQTEHTSHACQTLCKTQHNSQTTRNTSLIQRPEKDTDTKMEAMTNAWVGNMKHKLFLLFEYRHINDANGIVSVTTPRNVRKTKHTKTQK